MRDGAAEASSAHKGTGGTGGEDVYIILGRELVVSGGPRRQGPDHTCCSVCVHGPFFLHRQYNRLLAGFASAIAHTRCVVGSEEAPHHQPGGKMDVMGQDERWRCSRCDRTGRPAPSARPKESNQQQVVNWFPQYSANSTTTV